MPQIDKRISIGNIIQIATFLVIFAAAYSRISASTEAAANELLDHESRIRVIESTVATTLGRIDERLSNIERNTK